MFQQFLDALIDELAAGYDLTATVKSQTANSAILDVRMGDHDDDGEDDEWNGAIMDGDGTLSIEWLGEHTLPSLTRPEGEEDELLVRVGGVVIGGYAKPVAGLISGYS